MDDGSTKDIDVTDQWESLNRGEGSDTENTGQGSADSTTGVTDETATKQGDSSKEQPDVSTSEADKGAPSEVDNASTGTTNESPEQSQNKTGDNSTDEASPEGQNKTDTKAPLTLAEADRLYPYGMQIKLPDDINPDQVVSIQQGAEGSGITINLMQKPS